jgi:hypothetical protein
MQMYSCIITLITLHVLNNLLTQRRPPMLSESAVHTELQLCKGQQEILLLQNVVWNIQLNGHCSNLVVVICAYDTDYGL